LRATKDAVERARSGGGPQIIVADLLRLCGHGEHDDSSYITGDLKCSPIGRDCLKVAERFLLDKELAEPGTLAQWRTQAVQQVEEAVAQAQRETPPDPYEENWCALSSSHLADAFRTEQDSP